MADTRLYKVAITPCGKYVHGTEYDRLCLVLNATEDGGDGCSYVSLQKNKNVRPGTDDSIWALSLERGEQGERGPSGAGFSDVEITISDTTGTPSGTAVIANDTLYLSFSGMKGAPGPQGETGATGATGATGPKGATGATPDFSIGTVSTGAAGSAASANITGTAEEPVLNLTIPRGDTGVAPEDLQDAVDEYLEEHPVIQGTFSNSAKWSLLHLLEKVAYIDEHGREYLDDLYNKLFLVPIDRIEAVFTQGSDIIYDIYTLDSLKQYLVVTIYYIDGTSEIADEYTLSGTLESGLSTITVTYVEQITTTSFVDTFEATVTGTTKLYYYGDECSAITGGWQNKGFNLTAGTPTAQKTSDHLLVRFATSQSNQPASKTFSTINAIDLTGKTKLIVSLKAYNAGGSGTFWVYWPTTLAESTTQAGAFGSDYSSNRGNILPLGSPYTANPEYVGTITLTPLGTSRTSAYASLNLNLFDAYTAGAYVEIYAVAIV